MTRFGPPGLDFSRSTLVASTVVGLVMTVIGLGLGFWFRAPSDLLRSSESESVTAEVSVESRILSEPVSVTGRYHEGEKTDISIAVGEEPAVVTEVVTKAGDTLRSGDAIAKVSGHAVIALHGTFPLYRDLKQGDSGDDASALNTILRGLGYASGPGRSFTESTSRGLDQLYGAVGLTSPKSPEAAVPDESRGRETSSTTSSAEFRLRDFYFLPAASVVVEKVSSVGDVLGGDNPTLGTVRTGSNEVLARVGMKDIDLFQEGGQVTAKAADGSSEAIALTISAISEFRESADGEQESPGYDVRFDLDGNIPKSVADGTTLTVTATTEGDEESMAVPLSALRNQGADYFVVIPGPEAERCPVDPGKTASGWVEIAAECLAVGDTVIVGP